MDNLEKFLEFTKNAHYHTNSTRLPMALLIMGQVRSIRTPAMVVVVVTQYHTSTLCMIKQLTNMVAEVVVEGSMSCSRVHAWFITIKLRTL